MRKAEKEARKEVDEARSKRIVDNWTAEGLEKEKAHMKKMSEYRVQLIRAGYTSQEISKKMSAKAQAQKYLEEAEECHKKALDIFNAEETEKEDEEKEKIEKCSDIDSEASSAPPFGEYKKVSDEEALRLMLEAHSPQDPYAPIQGMFVPFHFIYFVLILFFNFINKCLSGIF